jgi:hypothetical protein
VTSRLVSYGFLAQAKELLICGEAMHVFFARILPLRTSEL